MATISTHTLNSVDGTHADCLTLRVLRIGADGKRTLILAGETDAGGRFVHDLTGDEIDTNAEYELELDVADYFQRKGIADAQDRALNVAVIRFRMPDVQGKYHMPFMLAPHSYSVWMAR